MIAWARLVVPAAWIMSASLACAGASPKASTPTYVRSPSLDYVEQLRWSGDGEIMGAHAHTPEDWLLAGATTDHLGPGWSWRGWKPRFDAERTRAGHGAWLPAAVCIPRPERPLSEADAPLSEADAPASEAAAPPRASAQSSTLPADPPLAAWVAAMEQVAPSSERFLSCEGH